MAKSSSKFEGIFLRREFDALAGRRYRSIWMLTTIMTLTILALGVAIGGLHELKTKMSNPFTNWVNLPIRFSSTSNALQVIDDFKDRQLLDRFLLDTIRPYRERNPQFVPPFGRKEVINYKIRSIDPDDKILTEAILNPDNIVHQYMDPADREFNCGIVLSIAYFNLRSSELEQLNTAIIMEENAKTRDTAFYHVPVLAVVKELPNNCVGVMPDNLFRLMGPDGSAFGFVNLDELREVTFAMSTDATLDTAELYQVWGELPPRIIDTSIKVVDVNGQKIQKVTLFLSESYSYQQRKQWVAQLRQQLGSKISYLDPYECHVKDGPLTIATPQYLALNFAGSTKEVRNLKSYVNDTYDLELSMDQVEDKENFYMVTRITAMLSTLLGLFGILSIILFIYNLIRMHLEKVKSSLGTLSAFGLKQSFLLSSYSKIVIGFLCISIVLSYGFSLIFKILLEQTEWLRAGIQIFSPIIGITMVGVLALVYVVAASFIRKSLDKSPGDLIYNR